MKVLTSFSARLAACLATVVASGLSAHADADDPVVVELFTSQGCSSCPPADALLVELAAREDVIALAYHVDYWDYLGWEDTFGSRENTQRQRSYAPVVDRSHIEGRKLRGSFTPEMVVGGMDSLVGSDREDVLARIDYHAQKPAVADVDLSRDGEALVISMAPVEGMDAATVNVRVVEFLPMAEVEIPRGENAGKMIAYANIVRSMRDVGRWDGASPAEIRLTDVTPPLAVLLQRGTAGKILAAAATE
ncbi:DUF1223 domain-containing protein [Halovulum sp. GXIMD14794]